MPDAMVGDEATVVAMASSALSVVGMTRVGNRGGQRCISLATRAVIVGAIAASGSIARAQAPAPDGNEQNGKRLFAAYYCSACHGTLGQGGAAGARIAPRPIPFAAFQKYLRQPAGQMVPYTAKVLSDRELADIYAFLKSIPAGPGAKSIQLLSQ
jgi:mono/diheme cytochrome c family protein